MQNSEERCVTAVIEMVGKQQCLEPWKELLALEIPVARGHRFFELLDTDQLEGYKTLERGKAHGEFMGDIVVEIDAEILQMFRGAGKESCESCGIMWHHQGNPIAQRGQVFI
jgi:hypothetical protein